MLDTSATWVLNDPSESLGFILKDQGFDVWMANSRGNHYSGEPPSWHFSWDEHATLDIPATIKKVRDVTGSDKVGLVAHSQGAAASLEWLSTAVGSAGVPFVGLLAPVTHLKHQDSKLFGLMGSLHMDAVLKALPDGPFTFDSSTIHGMLGFICKTVPSLCHDFASALFGPTKYCNESQTSRYASHWPDRSSRTNMAHWIGNVRSGEFAHRDGSAVAVRVPEGTHVAVWAGTADYLVNHEDMADLVEGLRATGRLVFQKTDLDYSHMSFTWSYNANDLVYKDLVRLLKEELVDPPRPRRKRGREGALVGALPGDGEASSADLK